MPTWKRLLFASAVMLILLSGFVTLILPVLVIDRAQAWVKEETGRRLKIASMSINPLTLTVDVHDLSLSETDPGIPFVTLQQLSVSFSLKSFIHRAPIIDALKLESPYVHLERLADNRFNFSDLIPSKTEPSPPPSGEDPSRFSINNLIINNGTIELVDSSLDTDVRHTIHSLNLALPALGNLPYMVENPVQPMLYAVINDAPLHVTGQLKPFSKTQFMEFDLSLDQIDLPFYLGYVPVELPVQLRNGRLSCDLQAVYRYHRETGAELALSGHVDLASLDIWDRQDKRLFFLPLLQVDLAPSYPLARDIHLEKFRIYNLEVFVNRDQHGVWSHSRLKMTRDAQDLSEEDPQPFKLLIDEVNLRDGVVHFQDSYPGGGFQSTAREITLDIEEFALAANAPIPLSLSFQTDYDETVSIEGHFLLEPLMIDLQAELSELKTAIYEPYYQDFYSVPLQGRMTITANLDIRPEQPLLVSQGQMVWRDAYMPFNDNEGLSVDKVEIIDLNFDLAKNRLDISGYQGTNAQMNFSRDQDGHWSLLTENFPVLAKLAEPAEATEATQESKRPEFSYHIGKLAFNNWHFDIRDNLPATPVTFEARNFNLVFGNLSGPDAVQSSIKLKSEFGRRGLIDVQGILSLADRTMDVSGKVRHISLPPFSPYLEEETNLLLVDGHLDADLAAQLVETDPVDLRLKGKLGINRIHVLDAIQREDLLKWDSLQIAGIKGNFTPLTITAESFTLDDYFAKIVINEEARLNLVEAFHKEVNDSSSQADVAAQTQEEPIETHSPDQPPPPEIRVDTVVLQGGQVDFFDRHLIRPFHADIRELGGRVEGLNSNAETRASLDLRGSLRNQSPLTISGTLNPLAETPFLDIEMSFRDIEMTPFSPYSGNYVGYLIEKGKLNLDLQYTLENDRLQASNEIFLDQFSLGKEVESEEATSLPVKLAVALLKDGDGEIHLDIPVSGSLEDPEFSVASVIWTVIKNLLVKAATSPLALLGALVGSGDEDFSTIQFEYGSSQLKPAEQKKLQDMAVALLDRPSLDIDISGFIDPNLDPEGYRKEQLAMQIKRLKYMDLLENRSLPEGTQEHEITVEDQEYEEFLWAYYSNTNFPKPRNFIGIIKKLPREEMEKMIYANTDVTPGDLARLARSRALAVQSFLVDQGKMPSERIFLKEHDITAAPEDGSASRARVELGASVR